MADEKAAAWRYQVAEAMRKQIGAAGYGHEIQQCVNKVEAVALRVNPVDGIAGP